MNRLIKKRNEDTLVITYKPSQTTHVIELEDIPSSFDCIAVIREDRFVVATANGVLTCLEVSSEGVRPIWKFKSFENVDLNNRQALQNPVLECIYV